MKFTQFRLSLFVLTCFGNELLEEESYVPLKCFILISICLYRGKKGFAGKRLILLSDLGGEFGDDQIQGIISGIKNSGTELNVM